MFRQIVNGISLYSIPAVIFFIVLFGVLRKVKVYDAFIEGAKEGIGTAVKILPYLAAMLFAVGIFRSSGAMDVLCRILAPVTDWLGIPAEVVPMGVMRSLSGSGALGMLAEILGKYGADSRIGRVASVAMGSTETTLYCIAVYYGSVGIKKPGCALQAGLAADAFSLLMAVLAVNLVFA